MPLVYGYHQNSAKKIGWRKPAIVFAIVVLHILILYLFISENKSSLIIFRPPVPLLYVTSEVHLARPLHLPADLIKKFPSISSIKLPDFEIEKPLSIRASAVPADLELYRNTKSEKFPNVFDPRLRKELEEANQLVSKPKTEKYKTTYLSDGRMMVELGDGECMVSMAKADSRERGTSWSTNTVRCGKTDSEKFMDNVQRDVDEHRARKHE